MMASLKRNIGLASIGLLALFATAATAVAGEYTVDVCDNKTGPDYNKCMNDHVVIAAKTVEQDVRRTGKPELWQCFLGWTNPEADGLIWATRDVTRRQKALNCEIAPEGADCEKLPDDGIKPQPSEGRKSKIVNIKLLDTVKSSYFGYWKENQTACIKAARSAEPVGDAGSPGGDQVAALASAPTLGGNGRQ